MSLGKEIIQQKSLLDVQDLIVLDCKTKKIKSTEAPSMMNDSNLLIDKLDLS